jgi:hypothetical protein
MSSTVERMRRVVLPTLRSCVTGIGDSSSRALCDCARPRPRAPQTARVALTGEAPGCEQSELPGTFDGLVATVRIEFGLDVAQVRVWEETNNSAAISCALRLVGRYLTTRSSASLSGSSDGGVAVGGKRPASTSSRTVDSSAAWEVRWPRWRSSSSRTCEPSGSELRVDVELPGAQLPTRLPAPAVNRSRRAGSPWARTWRSRRARSCLDRGPRAEPVRTANRVGARAAAAVRAADDQQVLRARSRAERCLLGRDHQRRRARPRRRLRPPWLPRRSGAQRGLHVAATQRPALELRRQQLPARQAAPRVRLLFWNQDTIRLDAGLRRDFIRLSLENSLTRPGVLEVLGSGVDLGAVELDSYVVARSTDHIIPWENASRSTQAARRHVALRALHQRSHPGARQPAGAGEPRELPDRRRASGDARGMGAAAPSRSRRNTCNRAKGGAMHLPWEPMPGAPPTYGAWRRSLVARCEPATGLGGLSWSDRARGSVWLPAPSERAGGGRTLRHPDPEETRMREHDQPCCSETLDKHGPRRGITRRTRRRR